MKTKQVIQLDADGYFKGLTIAEESPLEPGVWLMPGRTLDVAVPTIPDNHKAKWQNGQWVFEEIVVESEPEPELPSEPDTYDWKRLKAYPTIGDQLDALFKAGVFPEDMAAKIQAVKDKYPKE